MGTLKSTLKLESTDLFPMPLSFTKINNNLIEGSFSGFISIHAGTVAKTLNISSFASTVSYVYFEAPDTNTVPVLVQVTGGTPFAVLNPGDVAFFPYGDGTATPDDLQALTASGTAVLNYFIGENE